MHYENTIKSFGIFLHSTGNSK